MKRSRREILRGDLGGPGISGDLVKRSLIEVL